MKNPAARPQGVTIHSNEILETTLRNFKKASTKGRKGKEQRPFPEKISFFSGTAIS
jgi:ribosomal protein S21